MGRFLDLALILFSVVGSVVRAQDAPEPVEDPTKSPAIAVSVDVSFSSAETLFGVKLVNGKPTQAILSFSNDEPEPININFAGGSLWTIEPGGSQLIRNLTAVRYGVEVAAGAKESVPYNFATEMHPQDLRLNIAAVISDHQNTFYTVQAYNSTVSIVEQDTSIFDPQIIFLYIFILGLGAGTIYFAYTVWIAPYFGPPKRKGGDRPRKTKKVEAADVGTADGADGPAVTTGAKGYNEDWLPAHHLQRPEARRVKSGTPRPKSKGAAA